MKKKLVIKFWKAEKALAMQILEQEGLPKHKEIGMIQIVNSPELQENNVYLRGKEYIYNLSLKNYYFGSNQDRDEYLNKVVNAITDELFTGDGKLKIGYICEFSNNKIDWVDKELLVILPEYCKFRYIVKTDNSREWDYFLHARPLYKRTEPKIETNGEIITYTWEEE